MAIDANLTVEDLIPFLQQSNAIEGVFGGESLRDAFTAWAVLSNQSTITIPLILEVHLQLMRNQPIEERYKGAWRDAPVYVGDKEGKPWYVIPELMERWVRLANLTNDRRDLNAGAYGLEIRKDHVAFETIHPFIDGNGRTGRILYNWQRLRAGLPIHVIHAGKEQEEYYNWFR